MNFTGMPELSWKYGYPAVIVVSLSIVLISLWICKKKKRKVEGDAPACSSFVTEEAKSCLDCTYSEAVVGGLFTKAGTYYCNARNKKIHMDDLACSRFRE